MNGHAAAGWGEKKRPPREEVGACAVGAAVLCTERNKHHFGTLITKYKYSKQQPLRRAVLIVAPRQAAEIILNSTFLPYNLHSQAIDLPRYEKQYKIKKLLSY